MPNFAFNFLGRVAQFLIQLLLIKMLTMFLPKAEAANVFIVLLIAGGSSILFISPIGQFYNRYTLEFSRDSVLSGQLLIFLIYTILICPLVYLISLLYFELHNKESGHLIHALTVLYFFSITFNQVLIGMINIIGRPKSFMILSLCTQLSILLFLLLFAIGDAKYSTWLFCICSANLLVGGIAFFTIKDMTPIFPIKWLWQYILNGKFSKQLLNIKKFSGAIVITLICVWLFQVGFRFEVLSLSGEEEFAIFTVGYSLAVLIFAACEQLLNSFCLPIYYKRIHDGNISVFACWSWLAKIAVPTYTLALFFVIAFADLIVILLLDPSYHSARKYVQIAALLEFLRVTYSLISLHAHGINRTNLLVRPSLIGLCVFCVGHVFFYVSSSPYLLFSIAISANITAMFFLMIGYRAKKVSIDFPFGILFNLSIFSTILAIGVIYLGFNENTVSSVLFILGSIIIFAVMWLISVRNFISDVIDMFKNDARLREK